MNETNTCPKCGHAYDSVLDMWSHKNNSRICMAAQLTAALAEIERLRESILAALRIEQLWMPPEVASVEHEDEVVALHMMRDSFLKLTTHPVTKEADRE